MNKEYNLEDYITLTRQLQGVCTIYFKKGERKRGKANIFFKRLKKGKILVYGYSQNEQKINRSICRGRWQQCWEAARNDRAVALRSALEDKASKVVACRVWPRVRGGSRQEAPGLWAASLGKEAEPHGSLTLPEHRSL